MTPSYDWQHNYTGFSDNTGSYVEIMFTELGSHSIWLNEKCKWDKSGGRTTEYSIMVKYVRKEIREMSGTEREAFFRYSRARKRKPNP